MPVYQCYSPKGLLTKSAKAKIAEEITSIYCNATGSSASWVHVLFHEIPEGQCFVAGKSATKNSYILGINRHGRDLETRQVMLRQFTQMWTRITGQSEVNLWVSLIEIDSTNLMEAGLFFPEPSHEPEWIEENHARLVELGFTAP
jgi:phenylpyruvate tautomerase PptA (4-oxalocrotonate tautomerase family)